MILLQKLFAFLGAVAVLVTVHELGHYWVARLCGVKVLRFSVGMGKILFSRKFGADGTEWALSAIPIGGYVKMLDIREQEPGSIAPEDLPREFTVQPAWKRMAIVAAGPIANFLLAIGLFAAVYMHGVPELVPRLAPPLEHSAAFEAGLRGGEKIISVGGEPVRSWSEVQWELLQRVIGRQSVTMLAERSGSEGTAHKESVTVRLDGLSPSDIDGGFMGKLGLDLQRPDAIFAEVIEGGAAQRAGFRNGDRIRSVNGKPVSDAIEFVELVRASPEKPLEIDGVREGKAFHAHIVPEGHTEGGKLVGKIGVGMAEPEMTIVSDTLPGSFAKAMRKTWDTSVFTLKALGRMVVGQLSWKNITGPITIADYAGRTASMGAISYLGFLALISISLGVMNLLPIPVLDGGLLLYYSLEVLTGRPVSERFSEIAQRAGIGILMALMIIAVFNDIARLGS
jgi:regulator of sigma E protease